MTNKFWCIVKKKLANVVISLLTLVVIGICGFIWKTYDVIVNKYPLLAKEQKLFKQQINDNTKLTFTLYIRLVESGAIDGTDTQFLEELKKRYDL